MVRSVRANAARSRSVSKSRAVTPWGRIIAEAILIFGSVYVAIFLEAASQDRKDAREAREALAQVMAELREDQRDLVEIRANQEHSGELYNRTVRGLSAPGSVPGDSLTIAFRQLGEMNRTLYHRRSAWTTMVAAGQLADLDDPELVTLLGNLYENVSRRFEENGSQYDAQVNRLALEWFPETWDRVEHRLRRPDEAAVLRDRLLTMREAWNSYYLAMLSDYEDRIFEIIDGIEVHLQRHGFETSP